MRVLIAHGASGGAGSMRSHVDGLSLRGVAATAIDLPLRKAQAAVPAYRGQAVEAGPAPELVISGQSYGGRVASLLAAEEPRIAAGLICFSYPLHRPGAPAWDERTRHWPGITMPVLLLSGAADPMARLDLLERAQRERLPHARVVTFPRVGHSLKPVLGDALEAAAAFVRDLEPRVR
jgi:predicted alpha/beta-hydrolase family hydrolase